VKTSCEDAAQQQRAEISSRNTQENTSFRHQITGSTTSHTETSTSIVTAIYMNSIGTNNLKLGITLSFHKRFMAGRTYKYKPVPSSSRLPYCKTYMTKTYRLDNLGEPWSTMEKSKAYNKVSQPYKFILQ
jgi:hypothetical protein